MPLTLKYLIGTLSVTNKKSSIQPILTQTNQLIYDSTDPINHDETNNGKQESPLQSWKFFIHPHPENPITEDLIKVILHPTFSPQEIIFRNGPPYEVIKSGFSDFQITIEFEWSAADKCIRYATKYNLELGVEKGSLLQIDLPMFFKTKKNVDYNRVSTNVDTREEFVKYSSQQNVPIDQSPLIVVANFQRCARETAPSKIMETVNEQRLGTMPFLTDLQLSSKRLKQPHKRKRNRQDRIYKTNELEIPSCRLCPGQIILARGKWVAQKQLGPLKEHRISYFQLESFQSLRFSLTVHNDKLNLTLQTNGLPNLYRLQLTLELRGKIIQKKFIDLPSKDMCTITIFRQEKIQYDRVSEAILTISNMRVLPNSNQWQRSPHPLSYTNNGQVLILIRAKLLHLLAFQESL